MAALDHGRPVGGSGRREDDHQRQQAAWRVEGDSVHLVEEPAGASRPRGGLPEDRDRVSPARKGDAVIGLDRRFDPLSRGRPSNARAGGAVDGLGHRGGDDLLAAGELRAHPARGAVRCRGVTGRAQKLRAPRGTGPVGCHREQRRPEGVERRKAIAGIAAHGTRDDPVEGQRNVVRAAAGRHDRRRQDGAEDLVGRRARERSSPGDALVEEHRERVLVTCKRSAALAARLLGRQVGDGSHDPVGARTHRRIVYRRRSRRHRSRPPWARAARPDHALRRRSTA